MALPKWFRTSMAGASRCSGTAGDLTDLLYTCLVTGFGSVTLDSLAVSSNVATATYNSGHDFLSNAVVLIEGATPSGLNGEKRVTVTGSTTFTFDATGITDQTATGTITAKMAPAGWERTYSGTNKAVFRSPNVTGASRLYLRVDDTNAQYAYAVGYESMSDVDTGTNSFPTAAQLTSGVSWKKSNASSTSARNWVLVADDRTFYFLVDWSSSGYYAGPYTFGDISSFVASDAYHCAIMGYSSNAPADQGANQSFNSGSYAVTTGSYIARAYNQTTLSAAFSKFSGAGGYLGASGLPFPNAADNAVYLDQVWAVDSSSYRGKMRGLLGTFHLVSGALDSFNTTLQSAGDWSGRLLMGMKIGVSGPAIGNCWFDLSGPWA